MIRRVHAMMAKGTYIQHLQAERVHVYAVLYRGLFPRLGSSPTQQTERILSRRSRVGAESKGNRSERVATQRSRGTWVHGRLCVAHRKFTDSSSSVYHLLFRVPAISHRMPPANKRQKLSVAKHNVNAPTKKSEDSAGSENDDSGSGSNAGDGEVSGSDEGDSPNTDDEIAGATRPKSKNTAKRKYRATDASNLGATLQTLLSTDAPSTQPLSLKPSLARKRNDEKLELKAKKALKTEKKDKEDKGRVKDVIGGWGAESERALRKVAQRGGKLLCLFA